MNAFRKPASFKSVGEFQDYLREHSIDIPMAAPESREALARPIAVMGRDLPNRWAILPMEGWDCTPRGTPSELTARRWTNFALSGAALVAGTEAGAVVHEGRSSPRQLLLSRDNLPAIREAVAAMRKAHAAAFGGNADFLVGIQLTHSGRFAHPNDAARRESVGAYLHPLLDRKFGTPRVISDAELQDLRRAFVEAAGVAREAGFDFVDFKHAHGYLVHEFLTAHSRPGPYGGPFANRIRFSRETVESIREKYPDLPVAMRLSIFDIQPFEKGEDGVGRPMAREPGPYPYAFGGAGDGLTMDPELSEPAAFLEAMREYGVELVCGTIGSPYYSVHIQRPAWYPVSDGYLPPEDPLYNVSRHIAASRALKRRCPWVKTVLSGITALQEYAGCAAEAAVASGAADFAGLGRMALPYPDYCADHLAGRPFDRRRICRTFGECTNAPRRGCVSGCYPLDPFYKKFDGLTV